MSTVGPIDWDRVVVRLEYAARAVIEEKEKPRRLLLDELEGALRAVERVRSFRVEHFFDPHNLPPVSPVVRESFLMRFAPADAERLGRAGDVVLMAADASPAPPTTEPIGTRGIRAAAFELYGAAQVLKSRGSLKNHFPGQMTELEFDLSVRAETWWREADRLAYEILRAVHAEPQEVEGPPRVRLKP